MVTFQFEFLQKNIILITAQIAKCVTWQWMYNCIDNVQEEHQG